MGAEGSEGVGGGEREEGEEVVEGRLGGPGGLGLAGSSQGPAPAEEASAAMAHWSGMVEG